MAISAFNITKAWPPGAHLWGFQLNLQNSGFALGLQYHEAT